MALVRVRRFAPRLALAAALFSLLVTFVVRAQAPETPGQVRPRPAEGRQPEWPPPSIVDYHPRSTLVVPQHLVARARFPVIDIHSHHPTPISPEQYAKVVKAMDENNIRLIVNLSGSWGDRLRQGLAVIGNSPAPGRMFLFANVDFTNVGPGFGLRAAKQLEEDIKAGAIGLKIFKNLGLRATKVDGSRLKVDDPELDPIWEKCAELNVPVLIHVADPQEFFEPIDMHNERWLELALYPERRYQDRSKFPSFEELITERNNMLARHPRTRYILPHFGWHANDLARAGELMDRLPNVYMDVAAVLYDFGRQPRAARAFFVQYQDRILFGKDSFQPDEYPYYWRTFETADEYFDYYRGYHAFWKLYGLELPDAVLKKLYYKNALKVAPGLPPAGFPE
jgi:predicted TIM-barrel fold metal-dependent hydrolase